MFCLNENNIHHLYSQGIDMRKGVEGLCGIIRTCQYSPLASHISRISFLQYGLYGMLTIFQVLPEFGVIT